MNIKKKLINCFLFVFTLIGLFSGIQSVKAQEVNLNMTNTDWWWQRIQPDDGQYHSWHFTLYDFNGRVAYCIDPGTPEGTTYSTGNFDAYNVTNAQKERLMLLAYYGYEYPGHQTMEYRAATQSLLWETINADNTVFSSERWAKGTIYNISSQRNEIENLVRQHYVRPSFNGTTKTLKVGETITLTDTNNVLSNYYVSASNGAEVSINGNTLTVRATQIGNISIQFKKKLYTDKEYLVYYSASRQTMMSSGMVDQALSVLNIISEGGSVKFDKFDKDNNSATPQGEATLEGAVYGIYDSSTDALISKVSTNANGTGKLEHLPYFGNFYLKGITPSKGYELDTSKYSFSSTLDNIDNEIIVKEKVINRDVEITKVYATKDSKIMTPEPNVEFGFYDRNNNLYTKSTTDENGKLNVNLVYGSYLVKQLTTSKDTTKVKDFKVEVYESGNKIYYTISNAKIEAKLKVIKVDKDTGDIIERANIEFKIFNVDKNEYVKQTITYPKAQTIETFKTDDNGILITPYPLESGKYRLEEVDQVIDKYLWNKESVEFEIGENAKLIADNEYGILFETKFENKAVKGIVKITKTGEEVNLTDKGFEYKNINLKDVKIGIYANEDIYDNSNNLLYKKNTLVKELITDENGYATIEDLFLGKYYLQEIETVNNHVLDKTKYEFELKYKDQYTPTIEYTITIKNHLPKGTLEFTKTDFFY